MVFQPFDFGCKVPYYDPSRVLNLILLHTIFNPTFFLGGGGGGGVVKIFMKLKEKKRPITYSSRILNEGVTLHLKFWSAFRNQTHAHNLSTFKGAKVRKNMDVPVLNCALKRLKTLFDIVKPRWKNIWTLMTVLQKYKSIENYAALSRYLLLTI